MKNILSILAIFLLLCMCFTSCNTSDNSGTRDTNETITQISNKIEVNDIFLSKSEIVLGIGETTTLIATISPSNAENTLAWSSSNDDVVSIDNSGKITAKSEGDAVIKVEADNGILAVCNVMVKVKTGSVTGTVTYKYNNFVGHRADTDATVILVPKSVTSLPEEVGWGWISCLPDACFGSTVDGSGTYTIDNIPVGEYYLVVISGNTNENVDDVTGYRSWGGVYDLFSDEGQEKALLMVKVRKTRTTTISILENKTITYSYDFGITYL